VNLRLTILARVSDDPIRAQDIYDEYQDGQLVIGDSVSNQPSVEVRHLQKQRRLYAETFLAAVYPIGAGRAVVIAPLEDVALPPVDESQSIDELLRHLPAHCIVMHESELPKGERHGDWKTYAEVMAMWERLHSPFLAAADQTVESRAKIEAYRKTIRVDYACEFAHQRLADTAHKYAREYRVGAGPH